MTNKFSQSKFSYPCLLGIFLTIMSCDLSFAVIFKVYDWDGNGKVTFNDILEVLHDLTGSYMSSKQREVGPFYLLRTSDTE